tara:strand:- start:398 stop:775 length:378 start_codon:yes stop_codon:yes gene_type:complete
MPQPTFEDFWNLYPRRKAKKAAEKAWKKLKQGERTEVIEHLPKRAKTDIQWLKNCGEFIPYPATFLNQGCWMDEYSSERSRDKAKRNYKIFNDNMLLDFCRENKIKTHGRGRDDLIRALESLDNP